MRLLLGIDLGTSGAKAYLMDGDGRRVGLGYTPLRRLNLATWVDETQALELQSAAAIQAALESGQLKVEQPGVVINMPFVVWNNGNR